MAVVAAKTVAFGVRPRKRTSSAKHDCVLNNAETFTTCWWQAAVDLVSGRHGQPPSIAGPAFQRGLTGAMSSTLEQAGITCNENGIPFVHAKPVSDFRHPPGHAGSHVARVRRGRISRHRGK